MPPRAPPPPPPQGSLTKNRRMSSKNGAERSAYFARREAARVLRRVLQGDDARRATASIKSLVYSPSVRNKRATFALVCQTLKCTPLHHLLSLSLCPDMVTWDDLPILKDVLAATSILNRKWKVMEIILFFIKKQKQEELIYVTAYDILFGQVSRDDTIPDVLVLPSGIDLHDHPLVLNGSIFLQGKASSMVAIALSPKPGWKVFLVYSSSSIHIDVDIVNGDFLDINTSDPVFKEVRAILLDPSCSGSGISAERLDYLLPSYKKGQFIFSFAVPAVERVVYSTCSVHQTENEDVIKSVLPLATSLNFELATPFPRWPHRGLPVFEGGEYSRANKEALIKF
ncbi:hypothetical protein B296_00010997 [Ensete ventricosum]|uniref:NOL1/NOP2/NSUN 5/7 ferredoxin-like domain-containing protein n=1 Tax=Ensete ventricosum TaxID=4639 RepID=A0A427ALS5_ENSVE|nr:hypothetical protein B296_00010997 [Ensete ventricosum]